MSTLFDKRPVEVDPQWWYRATWRARQAAVIASMKRAERARKTIEALKAEEQRAIEDQLQIAQQKRAAGEATQQHASPEDRLRCVLAMLEDGKTEPEILLALGIRATTLDMSLRRAGRIDLARRFGRYRRADDRKQCPDCGGSCARRSTRCNKCNQAMRRAS